MQRIFQWILLIGGVAVFLSPSLLMAHTTFKKELGKKYPTMKISCSACHVDKKPKTQRNDFGKLFAKEFKGKDVSATFKSLKGDEKKKYEKEVMIPAFAAALKKIQKQKNKAGETYDALIKSGAMPGITKKEETTDKTE
ncbi:MAG: hypothetical protein P8K79_07135 [Mariniblastus sp.]|nr:hypothetical protein [Mariniblastus sp.]